MNVKLTKAQKIKILNSDGLYGIMQRILLCENKTDLGYYKAKQKVFTQSLLR